MSQIARAKALHSQTAGVEYDENIGCRRCISGQTVLCGNDQCLAAVATAV